MPGRQCGRGASSFEGDLDRVEQGQRRAGRRIHQQDRALDGGQSRAPPVIWEIGVCLERRIAISDRKARGLDVKSAVHGIELQRRWRDCLPLGVKTERLTDGFDIVLERQQGTQILSRQDQDAAHGGRASRSRDVTGTRRACSSATNRTVML